MFSQMKSQLILQAISAKRENKYQEMVNYLRSATTLGVEFNFEEQQFFSSAYRSLLWVQRNSTGFWSILDEPMNETKYHQTLRLANVENLKKICKEVIGILENNLLPKATDEQSKVAYYKMKGDYHFYLAEMVGTEVARCAARDSALGSYVAATHHLTKAMSPSHPIRLSLALNFSVFLVKMFNSRIRAYNIVNQVLDASIVYIQNTSGYTGDDSIFIMMTMQWVLKLWIRME